MAATAQAGRDRPRRGSRRRPFPAAAFAARRGSHRSDPAGDPCLLMPDSDPPGRAQLIERGLRGWAAAVRPAVPLARASSSFRCARQALALARRRVIVRSNRVVCSDDHPSTLLILSGEELLPHSPPSNSHRSGGCGPPAGGDLLHYPDMRFELEIALRARRLLSAGSGRPAGAAVPTRRGGCRGGCGGMNGQAIPARETRHPHDVAARDHSGCEHARRIRAQLVSGKA